MHLSCVPPSWMSSREGHCYQCMKVVSGSSAPLPSFTVAMTTTAMTRRTGFETFASVGGPTRGCVPQGTSTNPSSAGSSSWPIICPGQQQQPIESARCSVGTLPVIAFAGTRTDLKALTESPARESFGSQLSMAKPYPLCLPHLQSPQGSRKEGLRGEGAVWAPLPDPPPLPRGLYSQAARKGRRDPAPWRERFGKLC